MKKVIACLAICLTIVLVAIMLPQKSLSNSVTTQGLMATLDNMCLGNDSIYVKHCDEGSITYYELSLNSQIQNLLSINSWVINTDIETTKSYAVLRLGEGYEVVLYSNHAVFVEYDYASEDTKPSACYVAGDIDFDLMIQYMNQNGSIEHKLESMFVN